jgi:hypothetical protein
VRAGRRGAPATLRYGFVVPETTNPHRNRAGARPGVTWSQPPRRRPPAPRSTAGVAHGRHQTGVPPRERPAPNGAERAVPAQPRPPFGRRPTARGARRTPCPA